MNYIYRQGTALIAQDKTMKGVEGKGKMCEEFSPKYYGLCFLGGMLSSGPTHLAITPLDVLKVNMQVQGLTVQKSSSTLVSLISHLTFLILFMFVLQFAICR